MPHRRETGRITARRGGNDAGHGRRLRFGPGKRRAEDSDPACRLILAPRKLKAASQPGLVHSEPHSARCSTHQKGNFMSKSAQYPGPLPLDQAKSKFLLTPLEDSRFQRDGPRSFVEYRDLGMAEA